MGRGHIRQRGDAWELRVSAGSDPVTGNRRVISRTVRGTKADANRALTKLLGEVDQGAHRGPDATLGTLLDLWWESGTRGKRERDKRWAPNTRKGYADYRAAYLAEHEGRRVGDVTVEWLDRLYGDLGARLAPSTVFKVHTMLHDALSLAVRWGWLVWNPADRAERPKVRRRPVKVPSRSKVQAAVVAVAESDPDYAAMLHLEAVVGPRRAELLGLRWSDLRDGELTIGRTIVEDERRQVVVQDDTKTHRARRVALDPGTLAVLEDHRLRWKERARSIGVELEDAYLFPRSDAEPHTPQTPGQVGQRWRRHRARYGLEGVKLHAFRHAMCTHLLDQGVPPHDVAARAGHANANITLAIYTHPTTEGGRRAGDIAGL